MNCMPKDDDDFYRVKMVEMDMEAWGLKEERQVNSDRPKIKYVKYFLSKLRQIIVFLFFFSL